MQLSRVKLVRLKSLPENWFPANTEKTVAFESLRILAESNVILCVDRKQRDDFQIQTNAENYFYDFLDAHAIIVDAEVPDEFFDLVIGDNQMESVSNELKDAPVMESSMIKDLHKKYFLSYLYCAREVFIADPWLLEANSVDGKKYLLKSLVGRTHLSDSAKDRRIEIYSHRPKKITCRGCKNRQDDLRMFCDICNEKVRKQLRLLLPEEIRAELHLGLLSKFHGRIMGFYFERYRTLSVNTTDDENDFLRLTLSLGKGLETFLCPQNRHLTPTICKCTSTDPVIGYIDAERQVALDAYYGEIRYEVTCLYD